ncbi:hypothetical protein [Leptospira interrogans]|uniref:hypothetical protein n=1 Tax=Leptospira interrogans TaxID=173 RepID=UPI000773F70A|nr:hypothetical protein [Leptospira interrogans]
MRYKVLKTVVRSFQYRETKIELAWKNYVHEIFKTSNYCGKSNTVNNRRLALILSMDIENEYVLEEISKQTIFYNFNT